MKGWRTVAYHVLTTVAAVTGVLAFINLSDFGWQAKTVAIVGTGVKIADAVASLWLRYLTTTPIGSTEVEPL